ncbi:YchF/TatD family DNA exonuclease [Candidatus Woesearchaeota archaeon]|nr:YchF/TatD family DNA exonuclease [Candidatus Woesearchaeota archaeon]
MLLDVHCHLDHPYFRKDVDKVVQRAEHMLIVTAGINPHTNRFALEIAEKYNNVKAALGIYPPKVLQKEVAEFNLDWNVEPFDTYNEMKFIEEQAKTNQNVVAISEIGLDYSHEEIEKDGQKDLFDKMLKLAKKVDKPVIVHSRKAELDAIEILEQNRMRKVVMHCFCGKKSLIKRCIDNRWYFSIPPNVTRAQNFQLLADMTPLNQLLTETDSPYLNPYSREDRNEPAFVIEAVKKIAQIKKVTVEEMQNIIFKNYQDLF